MKYIIQLVVLLYVIFAPALSWSESNIKLLAIESEPASYYDGILKKGFYVDILREFSKRLNIKSASDVSITPYPRILNMLNNNQDGYVVSILFPDTSLIDSVAQLSPVGYFNNAIISLKGNPITWSNLKGKNIAIMRGTRKSYGNRVTQLINANEIFITPITLFEQGVKMLSLERVDGNLGPIGGTLYWLDRINPDNKIIISEPLIINQLISNLVVSVSPNINESSRKAMLERMDKTIVELVNEGVVKDMIESYINEPQPLHND